MFSKGCFLYYWQILLTYTAIIFQAPDFAGRQL